MSIPVAFQKRLTLPVIAAPLFLVSGPELVINCCKQGIVGTFPALNVRKVEKLEEWLTQISAELEVHDREHPTSLSAPYGVNIIAHRTNSRLEEDMKLVEEFRVPLVITSVGNPSDIAKRVHSYGGLVFHDVTTVEWARKAVNAGVDGLILVCGGAGGHAGLMNPFAFVPQVREFYDGPIALAGCISDGRSVYAAEALGADFAYLGTRFIACRESMAVDDYKQMLIESNAQDLVYTPAFSGIPANMLRKSISDNGLDPDNLPVKDKIDLGEEFNHEAKAWRDIWTAGQGVGSIHDVPTVKDIVNRFQKEYSEARGHGTAVLRQKADARESMSAPTTRGRK